MGGKGGRVIALGKIAIVAKAHKIFCYHSAALGLCNDMAASLCIPSAASHAAGKASHDVGFDVGGDVGFGGHGDSPWDLFPYDSP